MNRFRIEFDAEWAGTKIGWASNILRQELSRMRGVYNYTGIRLVEVPTPGKVYLEQPAAAAVEKVTLASPLAAVENLPERPKTRHFRCHRLIWNRWPCETEFWSDAPKKCPRCHAATKLEEITHDLGAPETPAPAA